MGDSTKSFGSSVSAERSLLTNSLWNYLGAGFAIVITLVTTPLYLRILGLERYGLLAILTAILAPMAVLNSGVTQSTVKFVASHLALGAVEDARHSTAAALLVNIMVGVLGALVCFVGAPALSHFDFKVSPELVPDAVRALRWMGAVWFLTQIAGNFRGVVEGVRDLKRVAQGDIANSVLTAFCCVVLTIYTRELSWFIIGQLIATSIMTLFWWREASRALGGLQSSWVGACSKFREVYRFSIWQMANSLVAIAANSADRYFIALRLSATSLGAYNVALRLQTMGRTLFYSANQALFPAASAASNQPGMSERLVVMATWHTSFMASLGLGWITICGPAFLRLWVGAEVSDIAGVALRILVLTLIFEIPSATGSSYLNAHARTRLTALNNVFTTVLTLGLMIPLGLKYGVTGVAVGALIGLVLTRPALHVWMYFKYFQPHVRASDYFSAFYGVGLCCFVWSVALSPVFDAISRLLDGALGFLIGTMVVCPLFLSGSVVTIYWVLNNTDRLREFARVVVVRNIPLVSPIFARISR